MNTERIETSIGWETAGVDKGLERVERAIDRMDKAEQKAIKAQQSRELEAARARLKDAQNFIKQREDLEREASDRRIALTKDEYKRLDALDRNRLGTLQQQMRQNQIRAGINPGGSAAGRASGGGGHGAGAGGSLLGGNARLFGDLLDSATGTPGWVMKLRALEHFGPALGRMLVPAGGAAAVAMLEGHAFKKYSGMTDQTNGLRQAMGEGFESPWMTNPFTNGALNRLPFWMRPEATAGRGLAASESGMAEQSQRIREEIVKAQASRPGFLATMGRVAADLTPGVNFVSEKYFRRREDESFDTEERGRVSLRDLDARQAGLINEKSAATRLGSYVDPLQGTLAKNRIEMEGRLHDAFDKSRAGQIGIEEYHARVKAAKSDRAASDFDANRQQAIAMVELRGEARQQALRANGGSPVAFANSRLQEATQAKRLAIGEAENKAADNKIEAAKTDLAIAERDQTVRKATLSIDYETARTRGNAEERARAAADAAQKKASIEYEALLTSKEATQEQRKQAAIALEQANTARVMLNREQASALIRARTSDATANIRFRAEAGTLGAGSVDKERAGLQANVDIAREQLRSTQEIAEKQGYSLDSVEAIHRAQEGIANALLKQKGYELELSRSRRIELGNAQTETAALRLQNVGRGDQAAMLQGRHASEEAQYNALRESNPDLAAELAAQQKARETGAFMDKFYNADGTKKDRGKLNREEQQARITAGRRGRAGAKFERDLGLIDVRRGMHGEAIGGTDPFTHQHVSAAEVRQRLNRASDRAAEDKQKNGKGMADVWQVLNERLPKASNN